MISSLNLICGVEVALKTSEVLGLMISPVGFPEALSQILGWAKTGESRMVCAADVHFVMRHRDAVEVREAVAKADMVTPDGMPLVWALRRQGYPAQERVCGPDLTLALCAEAAAKGIPVGFYGGRPEVVDALRAKLVGLYPTLPVVYAYSPPFRALTDLESQAEVDAILASGARLLFVGLGCPKQEKWMAGRKGTLPLVMLGVGAAFDFHAGTIKRAPAWIQRLGLEWLFRVGTEPRRLARRALQYYPRFMWLVSLNRIGIR